MQFDEDINFTIEDWVTKLSNVKAQAESQLLNIPSHWNSLLNINKQIENSRYNNSLGWRTAAWFLKTTLTQTSLSGSNKTCVNPNPIIIRKKSILQNSNNVQPFNAADVRMSLSANSLNNLLSLCIKHSNELFSCNSHFVTNVIDDHYKNENLEAISLELLKRLFNNSIYNNCIEQASLSRSERSRKGDTVSVILNESLTDVEDYQNESIDEN